MILFYFFAIFLQQEEDIAMLIAQQYYIDHGSTLDSSILNGSIPISQTSILPGLKTKWSESGQQVSTKLSKRFALKTVRK
jgi:hypothetical protein